MSCELYRKKRYDPDPTLENGFPTKIYGVVSLANQSKSKCGPIQFVGLNKFSTRLEALILSPIRKAIAMDIKSQADEYFILQLVVEMPGIYLQEIQQEL